MLACAAGSRQPRGVLKERRTLVDLERTQIQPPPGAAVSSAQMLVVTTGPMLLSATPGSA
jgi:hypothetical protein